MYRSGVSTFQEHRNIPALVVFVALLGKVSVHLPSEFPGDCCLAGENYCVIGECKFAVNKTTFATR